MPLIKNGKVFPIHAMKAYRRSRGSSTHILALYRGEWFTSHPVCCSLQKGVQYPLNRRLSGPQSWSWLCREEKNLLPLPGFEPQIIQFVDWFLYRVLYSSSTINETNEI